MTLYLDSHAHLTSPQVLPQLNEVLQRAKSAGVDHIVNICTDQTSLEEGLLLASKEPWIVNAGATTPHDAESQGEAMFPIFEEAARALKLVAIGETGLDYYYSHLNPALQKKFLVRYLHLAASLHLPVIFHCRDAFEDLFAITDAEYPKGAPAILHCFTGTMKDAVRVWERGWYLSLSGIVTYKKTDELKLVAKEAPLQRLLLETDTPYLSPQSHRGKQNEPAFIVDTVRAVAALRGMSVELLAQATRNNGLSLFY